jgi:diguanylate cyclase (GGDEF)-like protein
VHRNDLPGPDEPHPVGGNGRPSAVHPTPVDSRSTLSVDDGALWDLFALLAEADTPQLLHDVLRQVAHVLSADEAALFAGHSPPMLITAYGRRAPAEQRRVTDRRLLHAVATGEVVSLAASDPLHGWRVDDRTTVRTGIWVPAPAEAPTPTVVRVLRERPGPLPRGAHQLLSIVARRLAGVLHGLQQQRFDESRHVALGQLTAVSAGIARDLDVETIVQRVATGVTAATDFGAATVELRHGATVQRVAAAGDDELAVGDTSPLPRWRAALATDHRVGGATYRIPIAAGVPAHDIRAPGAGPGLVTPLRNRHDEVIGFLALSQPRTGAEPSSAMVQTVELFAGQAEIALIHASLHADARRQRDIAHTLMRVTTAVSRSLEADEILATCCEAAQTHSVGERATILLIDDAGRVGHAIAHGDDHDAAVAEAPRSLDDCALLADAAASPEPVIIDDVTASDRYADTWIARRLRLRSAALYPLRAGDDTLGVLLVDSHTRPVRFGESEIRLLSQIGAQAAVGLHHSTLHAQTREQADRNAGLLELTTAMTTTFEFEAIFARIVEAVRSRMDGHAVAVLRLTDGAMQVLGSIAGDRLRDTRPPLVVPMPDGLDVVLESICSDGTVLVDDVRTTPALAQIALPSTRSVVLAAPHDRVETDVLVTVSSTRPAAFTPADADFLADLAQITKLAVRNSELFDEVAQAARRDPLTGLLNRRVFWDTLQSQLQHLPTNATLAVAVLDADDFKRINDRLGHVVGDTALGHIADRLRRAVRPFDTVFRVGGEEFTVVLPDATDRDALTVMERARLAVRRPRADLPPVSVSIGVAVAPYDGQTADALFSEADRALLQAKREGKDRVVLRSELP